MHKSFSEGAADLEGHHPIHPTAAGADHKQRRNIIIFAFSEGGAGRSSLRVLQGLEMFLGHH